VTTFYTIDRANERIPEVRELLLRLRSQREDLVRLRDRYLELTAGAAAGEAGDDADRRRGERDERTVPDRASGSGAAATDLDDARLVRLRIKGIVDQMGASVARIDGWGITLRDIQAGRIDFPALVNGRQVWLCWRLGEEDVAWWHELDTGFAGRQPLSELR
jgi:hypothetical protein